VAQHAVDEVQAKAVPELIFMMRDRFPSIFLRAAEALGRIRDEQARQDLEMWAKKHADPDMRETCVVALGRLGAKESLATILHCMRDQVADVRRAALEAAKGAEGLADHEEFYDSVVRLSKDEDTWISERACEILIDCGDLRGLIGLVEIMKKVPDELRRYTILMTLANVGDPRVVPLLQRFAGDTSSLVRDQAIHVIRQLSGNSGDAKE
jgi:HEAT repeat protein